MKKTAKKILQWSLVWVSVRILRKYKPKIIGVTGSVGKTSTTQAIYAALNNHFSLRKNIKNYNNEIGVPLSIIGSETGGKSIFKWLNIFTKAVAMLFFKQKDYPDFLLLEMGADRPGDIKHLSETYRLDTGVVTSVSEVHAQFFGSLDRIAKEKSQLVRHLPKDGFAILNNDDDRTAAMKKVTNAKVVTYGLKEDADICATAVSISHDINHIQGISFKLKYKGSTIPVLLPKVVGRHLVYPALAAIAVAISYGLNPHDIIENLKMFEPPQGRMRLIAGIKGTIIIDDTYNSSPIACKRALEELGAIELKSNGKKYAVFGDMLELGEITERAHQEIGREVHNLGIDYLIAAGERSRDFIRGAEKAGMAKEKCFQFVNAQEAGKFLQERLSPGDLVLVKGSQGMRMEKVVKEIMAEPQRASELLVRQDSGWN